MENRSYRSELYGKFEEMKKFVSGQSVLEYSLTGLLIAMVAISTLIALGASISSNLNRAQATLASSNSIINLILGDPAGKGFNAANNTGSNSANLIQNPLLQNLPLQTDVNPTVISTSQMVLVSGANGATNYLASTLTQHTNALLAQGSISQEQANQIYNLANAGHDLANTQAQLEKALAEGQTTIKANGKTYTLSEFASELGFNTSTSAQQNWSIEPDTANTLLKPFAQQYALLKQSSALQDPQVAQQVNDLVMQIGALSDAISWSFCNSSTCQANTSSLDGFKATTASHFQKNMIGAPLTSVDQVAANGASAVTNHQSAAICQSDAGTDKGKQCTAN